MRRTSGHTRQAFVVVGLFLLTGFVSRAPAQGSPKTEDSVAFFREFPVALVYRGVALYTAKDYQGAIAAWEGYLARAGRDADSVGVNELIRDAWIHAYPLSLVYEGYAQYQNRDIVGAIRSLERYIELAPAGEDTGAIRDVIANVLAPEVDLAKVR